MMRRHVCLLCGNVVHTRVDWASPPLFCPSCHGHTGRLLLRRWIYANGRSTPEWVNRLIQIVRSLAELPNG